MAGADALNVGAGQPTARTVLFTVEWIGDDADEIALRARAFSRALSQDSLVEAVRFQLFAKQRRLTDMEARVMSARPPAKKSQMGNCAVCGALVGAKYPSRKHPASPNAVADSHRPANSIHAYDHRPGNYCRGSNSAVRAREGSSVGTAPASDGSVSDAPRSVGGEKQDT